MAALTGPRNTPERDNLFVPEEQQAKTNLVFFHGQMGAVDATGFLIPAITSTTLKRFCRINLSPERKVDMTGLASGAKTLRTEFGCFRWDNSTAGDLIAQADVGNTCFAVDDHTVAKTNAGATRSVAGTIMAVDSSGVWVQMNVA